MSIPRTLRELREEQGICQQELAKRSGISIDVITRVERGNGEFGVHEMSATLLARALNKEVTEIRWPASLSHRGRPPGTGNSLQFTVSVAKPKCTRCFLELPLTGVCDYCD